MGSSFFEKFYAKMLPAELIINNYVKGERLCNYELYLTEFLNASDYFSNRLTKPFVHQKEQNYGECDAYSGEYGIDFKLVISMSEAQAKRELSVAIRKDSCGGVVYSKPQGRYETIRKVVLVNALKLYNYDDLEKLSVKKEFKTLTEKDINMFLKTLRKQKNLFLFLPLVFLPKEEVDLDEAINSIKDFLNDSFRNSFLYREKRNENNYKTFFSCFLDEYYLIFLVKSANLDYIENIPIIKSKTFTHLKEYDFCG